MQLSLQARHNTLKSKSISVCEHHHTRTQTSAPKFSIKISTPRMLAMNSVDGDVLPLQANMGNERCLARH